MQFLFYTYTPITVMAIRPSLRTSLAAAGVVVVLAQPLLAWKAERGAEGAAAAARYHPLLAVP